MLTPGISASRLGWISIITESPTAVTCPPVGGDAVVVVVVVVVEVVVEVVVVVVVGVGAGAVEAVSPAWEVPLDAAGADDVVLTPGLVAMPRATNPMSTAKRAPPMIRSNRLNADMVPILSRQGPTAVSARPIPNPWLSIHRTRAAPL
jgi:hypothetical protein